MITAEVQQVTTRQQTKNVDWAAQDEIRKTAQAWVEKVNAPNTERMQEESTQQLSPLEEDLGSPDPVWQALAGCAVTITMEKLLQLVPRFRSAIKDCITGKPDISVSTNFTETSDGPMVVDHNNPAIKLVLQGKEIAGCIIDRGSSLNVIRTRTCEQLGISG